MGKISKEEIARLEGMKMAYEIAKERGIDELEQDVKWRGALNVCPQVSVKRIYELVDKLDEHNRMKVGAASAWALTVKMSLPNAMLEQYLDAFNERMNAYREDANLLIEDEKLMCGDQSVIAVSDKFTKEELKDGSYRIIKKRLMRRLRIYFNRLKLLSRATH